MYQLMVEPITEVNVSAKGSANHRSECINLLITDVSVGGRANYRGECTVGGRASHCGECGKCITQG